MFGFKINDSFLDLFDGTEINLSLNSPLFQDDLDIIPGSYSLPVTVPLTDKNNLLLNHPSRLDNFNRQIIISEVSLYISGVDYLRGKLYVFGATNSTAKVSLLVNGLKDLRDVDLTEVSMGSYQEASQESMITHMNATATSPLDYNYAFFPVYSETFVTNKPDVWETVDPYQNFQYFQPMYINFWRSTLNSFVYGPEYRAASLFPRIDYVLNKAAEHLGYTLENNWQTDDELRQLYLVTAKNMYNVDEEEISSDSFVWELSLEYSINQFVPEGVKVSDLFKQLGKTFFLAIVYDPYRNSVVLTPLKDVIAAPEKHDWTTIIAHDYEVEAAESDFPSAYGYQDVDSDTLFETNAYREIDPETYEERINFDYKGADAGYFTTYETMYYIPTNTFWFNRQLFRRVVTDGEGDARLSGIVPLFMKNNIYSTDQIEYNTPRMEQAENSSTGLRMIFYRGLQNGSPYASNSTYYRSQANGDVDLPLKYSLLWNGPKGIYEVWGKEWIDFTMNTKTYKTYVNLLLSDLLNFRWTDKVRVKNINYLVRTLNIRCTANGIKPTAVILNSVTS